MLPDGVDPEAGCFENPDYEDAIIGTTTDGALVYDYDLMVAVLMEEDPEMTVEDAIEWMEYNVVRVLPYMGDLPAVIMHGVEED